MLAIINYYGEVYGYEIYKKYKEVFGAVSLRLIYYHLDKGVKENIIIKKKTEMVNGEYSWGQNSERIYYSTNDAATIETKYIIDIKNKENKK